MIINPYEHSSGGGGGDPHFSAVSLLLSMDGANGSTTFIDLSPAANTVTPNGGIAVETATVMFGTGALGCGSGLSLTVPVSSGGALDLGTPSTDDFTIECWFYDDFTGFSKSPFANFVPSDGFRVVAGFHGSGFIWYSKSGSASTASPSYSASTWLHYAAVCHAGTLTQYVDGVGNAGDTNFGSTIQPTMPSSDSFYIGNSSVPQNWNGFIDEFRVTKGYARYTSNFTPPTAIFPRS